MQEIYEGCNSWTGLSNKTTLSVHSEGAALRKIINQTFGSVPQHQNSAGVINP